MSPSTEAATRTILVERIDQELEENEAKVREAQRAEDGPEVSYLMGISMGLLRARRYVRGEA